MTAETTIGGARFAWGDRTYAMGIVNVTPDSFSGDGLLRAVVPVAAALEQARGMVAEGADLLDVGGVKAGPGAEVGEAEELDRVVPAVEALHERIDLPLSVDTWRATVARHAFEAGAVVGNDISGFADPEYLATAAGAGASAVATHIRLQPRVADPDPEYPEGVVPAVRDYLVERARQAEEAGIPKERVMIDAGLDLGKTAAQSAVLLRESERLASLGYPLLLSASNKTFLGVLLDLAVDARRAPSLAAVAYGVSHGCRIVRVHDVAGTVRVVRTVERFLEAEAEAGAGAGPSSGATA